MSSLDDDHHESGHKKLMPRLSMDKEFHESELLDSSEERGESSHSAFDDDDDSFGAASDDCAPDKAFLDSILEDYHPERVNLLDQSVPEPLTKPIQEAVSLERRLSRSQRSSRIEFDSEEQEKEPRRHSLDSEDERATNGTLMDSESADDTENQEQMTETSERDEAEAEDTFTSSPRRTVTRPGLQRPGLEQTAETSTKKSFRSINGKNFWSKPFRRVARSMKRGGSDS